jgi:hypothetical protein
MFVTKEAIVDELVTKIISRTPYPFEQPCLKTYVAGLPAILTTRSNSIHPSEPESRAGRLPHIVDREIGESRNGAEVVCQQ